MRIWVGTTVDSHAGPNTNGMTTGASATSPASSGNTITVSIRTMRIRRANMSSTVAARESTGKAIWYMMMLIFFWYSTASWNERQYRPALAAPSRAPTIA